MESLLCYLELDHIAIDIFETRGVWMATYQSLFEASRYFVFYSFQYVGESFSMAFPNLKFLTLTKYMLVILISLSGSYKTSLKLL